MFSSLTREMGWPWGTCRTHPELPGGSQTSSEPGEAVPCVRAEGESCLCFTHTSLPSAPRTSTDLVPPNGTSTALFWAARRPPGAGTAVGAGGDSLPLPALRGGGPAAGREQGITARNPAQLLGTAYLWVRGSNAPLQLARRCFLPRMLTEKLGGAAGQPSALTSGNPHLHQASHGCIGPQLLPGDAGAESHQIPTAAGEDPGEHPAKRQRLPGPAGSRPRHGPGQRQYQRV